RSGTDRIDGPRALSGGSHVRNLSLLGEGDLWLIFAASSGAIATLTIWVVVARAAWLAMLVLAGYILGVAYTVPPIATAYRPFAGEWFGGFPGVLLSGLGAYAIQTRQLSIVAVLALSAHALVCMGMLIVHHYLDAQMDARARPQKRTSVVALGFRNAKRYAAAMTAVGAILFGALALAVRREFIFGALFTAPAVWIHLRIRPTDLKSVTRGELQVIQLGIAAGLSTAVALAPSLWPMIPLAAGDRMGEIPLRTAGIPGSRIDVVHKPLPTTTAGDTVHAVENTIARGADLILFCGGDGTARDVASVVQDRVPILGIPAGVKMHSGLFAVSPSAAARLLAAFLRSELRIGTAAILDLDEDAYRKGEWRVRLFATAKTLVEPHLVSAGKLMVEELSEESVRAELTKHFSELFSENPDTLFLLGPGSTLRGIASSLGIEKTLLGVDAVLAGKTVAADVNEAKILELLNRRLKAKLVVSPIGAQG